MEIVVFEMRINNPSHEERLLPRGTGTSFFRRQVSAQSNNWPSPQGVVKRISCIPSGFQRFILR